MVMHNKTSSTDFLNTLDFQIIEFMQDGLKLVAPKSSCHIGHHINIGLCYTLASKKYPPSVFAVLEGQGQCFVAKVNEIEDTDNKDFKIVTTILTAPENKNWQKVLRKLEKIQQSIHEIFEKNRE